MYGPNYLIKQFTLEFELWLQNVVNIDEVTAFFGLSLLKTDLRTADNITGWAISGGNLVAVNDKTGAETTTTGFGETLEGTWNKLKIKATPGHVKFYVNEVLKADHTTNIRNLPYLLNFYTATGVGGPATLELGQVRCWSEDAP
jgi:hypothetical protein